MVVVPFPFSQAAGEKRRPAIVLASWPCLNTTDYLLCLVSAQHVDDPYIVPLPPADLEGGSLNRVSYVRPSHLFTTAEGRIVRRIGTLSTGKLGQVLESIRRLLHVPP